MTTISQERAALMRVGRPIRTREQAGFRFQRYAESKPVTEPASLVFVHITITNPSNYASDDAHARAVEAIGISRFPNTGISYNRLLMQSGGSYEGQPMGRRGAHTVNDKSITKCASVGCPSRGGPIPPSTINLNTRVRAYAICQNVGDEVTVKELDSLARTIAADVLGGMVTRDFDLHGHRCVSPKDCPAAKMWAKMGSLLTLIKHYIAVGFKPVAPPSGGLSMADAASLEQHLKTQDVISLGRYQRFERTVAAQSAVAKAQSDLIKALSAQVTALAQQVQLEDVADDAALQALIKTVNDNVDALEAIVKLPPVEAEPVPNP